jgi:acetyl esterase/lipase
MLKFLALFSSAAMFFIVVWIIVPAPSALIWLLSIAAGEWSLWFSIFSLLLIFLSVYFLIFGGDVKFWTITLIFSLAAFVISLYPLLSSLKVARENNVTLSLTEYFSGLKFQKSPENSFTTRTFANVDGKDLKMDIYAPQTQNENNGAAIISVHGGGWNARTRNDFPQWNEWFAANGYTVFDIDYRLAPQPNYLTATADVKCAIQWIKNRAEEFKISSDRIVIFGRSAGAHLALLAAYSAGNKDLPPSCESPDQTENVRAVVSVYAPIDMFWGFDNPANLRVLDGPKVLSDFLGGDPHSSEEIKNRFTLATPTAHISPETPPTLFIHGGKDQLVREENMFFADEKLTGNNVAHKTIFIPYAQHGFDYNIHGIGSQIIKPVMLDFLKENTK